MSGPTGSGKSTTLNAILRELNTPDVNILTLENPVEDEVPGITHCDLKSSKPRTRGGYGVGSNLGCQQRGFACKTRVARGV